MIDEHHKAFTPFRVGSLTLRNRIVMAPMTRRMAAEDGIPTDDIVGFTASRSSTDGDVSSTPFTRRGAPSLPSSGTRAVSPLIQSVRWMTNFHRERTARRVPRCAR